MTACWLMARLAGLAFEEVIVPPDDAESLGPLLTWIRENLDAPLDVDTFARRCAMSPRTFFRRFSAQMGMAPSAWLAGERIGRARGLLEEGRLSLADVSAQCGYDSPETFRVAFKRAVSVAPGAYRARFARDAALR